MSSESDEESLIILNKVCQYGFSGHKYYEFIGVYSSSKIVEEQIDFYQKNEPATSDYPYYFEVITCPINHIGSPNDEFKIKIHS